MVMGLSKPQIKLNNFPIICNGFKTSQPKDV